MIWEGGDAPTHSAIERGPNLGPVFRFFEILRFGSSSPTDRAELAFAGGFWSIMLVCHGRPTIWRPTNTRFRFSAGVFVGFGLVLLARADSWRPVSSEQLFQRSDAIFR